MTQMTAKFFYPSLLLLFFSACQHPPIKIKEKNVNKIELIEIEHHYANESLDISILYPEFNKELINDLNNAVPISNHRIFSCHELSIHYKNGHEERYITDGKFIERIKDKKKFKLVDLEKNLITKYWGISERDFCIKKGHQN
jgi:hypothetical protein